MKKIIEKYLIFIVILTLNFLIGCQKEKKVISPVLTTSSVSSITANSAVSGGNVTDDGGATVITRGVCWSVGITPTISDSKTSDGAGAGSFTSNITGLNGGAVYYARAYATNRIGTGYGMVISFTTSPVPTSTSATNITPITATLNGTVYSNYLSTIITFEFGTTTSYGINYTATQSPITGNSNTNVNANISGLVAGTLYHYRVKAVNSVGTTYSNDITFLAAGQAPTVTAMGTTLTTITTVTLNGSVNANYLSSKITFEYGTTTNYGSTTIANQSPLTGNMSTNVSANITGLSGGTGYHFRIKAVNFIGTSYSDDKTFATLGQVPSVWTVAATFMTSTSAQLNGTVNANYFAATVTFEYGATISYGNTITTNQSPIAGNANINVSANITGLILATVYHYRIKAINSLGTTYGVDMTFTPVYSLGENLFGGLVFYIDITGQHGLVCAPTDQSITANWGCYNIEIAGATGTNVGTGYQNTIDIVFGCSTVGNAAQICYDLTLNGYDDWFLPSILELDLMNTNLKNKGIGSFANDWYISSSQTGISTAYFFNFNNGFPYNSYKSYNAYCRAVRVF
jgi:hypothetical protein